MTNPEPGGRKQEELSLMVLKMRSHSRAGKPVLPQRALERILPGLLQLLVQPESLDLKKHKPGLRVCFLSVCLLQEHWLSDHPNSGMISS